VIFISVGEPSTEPVSSHFSDRTVLVLHLAGFAVFLASLVVSSILLRGSLHPDARPGSMPPPPPGAIVVTDRTRLSLMVRWALMESSAIFGLLAAFLSREPLVFLPLGALAAVGMLASYPSDDRLREMASQSA
jgi:hypothetical protein